MWLLIAGLVVAASLPYWLPGRVVALRIWLFARVNGEEGIPIPGRLVDVEDFMRVYSHPAANGRSRGAALSDLFWYWLSPGPEIHQEHLEPGPRYDEVARTTRHILTVPTAAAEQLAVRCVSRSVPARRGPVRLRDLMMPVWAEFYYELVFGERCPPAARELIVANANDVVTALKCCGLRHLDRRLRLTRYLLDRLDQVPHRLPASLTDRERALYLHGTFFTTAVVQTSEAMAHLLMVLARHREWQPRVVADPRLLDHVMAEALRLYPLFGVAHRITSADIEVGDSTTIPAGSVVCFNYPEFHRSGFKDANRFDPNRWATLSSREAHHIPFGAPANRPCPAWHLAPIAMRAATRELLGRFAFATSASHTRSMPNRGPCLVLAPGTRPRALRLLAVRLRDRWEDLWRSLVQVVLGGYMVWDARRLRLCTRYFEAADRP